MFPFRLPSLLPELWLYFLSTAVIWTALVGGSLAWNVFQNQETTQALAHKELLSHFNKDRSFRLWGTKHGGVYVPISEETPPSPYMAHIPERDIVTPSGKALTLLNPAYMVRQLMDDYAELYGVKGKITGQVLLRPENAPDPWEEGALEKLRRGNDEAHGTGNIDGAPYMRLMRPLYMDPGCMKCHGHLGFEVGDLRGGISVSIPMQPYLTTQLHADVRLIATHFGFWILGLGVVGFGTRKIGRYTLRNQRAETEIRSLNRDLERRVVERTRELTAEVAERKRVEENRRKLFRAVDQNPVMVFITDTNGVIEYINPKFSELTGYSFEEVKGKTPRILGSPSTPREVYKSLWETILDGQVWHGDIQDMRKDGSMFWASVSISPVKSPEGDVTHFVAMHEDITDRKLVESELEKARKRSELAQAEAESANQAKSEFLSAMSHELRTPLNAIIGFAQLLETPKHTLSDEQKGYAQYILQGGEHLLELVNGVLDLATIESGRLSLSIEPVSVDSIVEPCILMATSMSRRFDVQVIDKTSLNSDQMVMADMTRAKQVLLNVLSNAVKYNRANGTVTLECTNTDENFVSFKVSDTGIGISEAQQENLFRPFDRLGHKNTNIEGTGIGLTITKQLMELMGGTISFKSAEGKGSVFWIDFPRANSDQIQRVRPAQIDEASDVAAVVQELPNRKNILYVEDNPANVELMQTLLARQLNVNLVSVGSAEEGLAQIEKGHPDLILMDIDLPGMSGIEACKVLKGSPDTCHIPVVAVSANAMARDIDNAMKVGFKAYITKPFMMGDVLATITAELTDAD